MSFWTPEHRALLDAIRADDTVPILVRRLTSGAISPTKNDARRWRGWALALRDTPAGAHLVEQRHSKGAWPQAWNICEAGGLSARADHHSALLFRELAWRLAEAGELDESERAWNRSLRAWARLEQTTYLAELGERLTAGSDVDAGPIIAELIVPDIDRISSELKRALQLGVDQFPPVEPALAAWSWACLDAASAMVGEDGHNGLIARARQSAMEAKAYAVASAATRFRRGVEAIDWANGDEAAITAPFLWLRQTCDVVEYRENVSATALKSAIDGAWKLRKIDRDEEPVFRALIEAAEPFADAIVGLLESGGAFGQGSRAADYLVFCGELATGSDARRAFFERALDLSPGHRNASLLYSYEILVDVEVLLSQISANPALVTRVPLVGDSVEQLVHQAATHLDQVERIYPYNSRLDEFRARVATEADRLGVQLNEVNDE